MRRLFHLFAVGLLAAGGGAVAQDIGIGAQEFMNSCAQCHGEDGTGNGYLAGFLNKAAPDLTVLQKENGGVFPVSAVYAVIDGTAGEGVHGGRDMPAWGDRYAFDATRQLGMEFTRQDREAFVRARILALIEFIAAMQVD